MKDNFSAQASAYAAFRPQYPPGLFDFICRQVKNKRLVWDCATGNGQAAKELAKYFEKVYATDISEQQLANAATAPNITYAKEPAEQTSLATSSADLITVAQALHWFDFDNFYKEVKRVSAPGGLIAVWLYQLISVNPEIDAVIHEFHFGKLMEYYDEERKHVDDAYANIPFPFKEIACPPFEIKLSWSLADFEGYFNTSSAVQKFIKQHGYNPVTEFIQDIKRLWPESGALPVRFPVRLIMGYVQQPC